MRLELLSDRGVRSAPARQIRERHGLCRLTVETLWAKSMGLGRDEGARVDSPYFSSLSSALPLGAMDSPIDLLHSSHDLPKYSIDTYSSVLHHMKAK